MVVGCGALGNEVLKNLVLFGIEHIVIVDFDTIEPSNLTRSILFRKRMLKLINSKLSLQPNAFAKLTHPSKFYL